MKKLIATVLIAQLLGGCSFAFVKGPPQNHRERATVDCSTSRVAPVLDLLWTGLQTLNVVGAASVTDEEWNANFNGDPPFERGTAVPLYVGLAALAGASMIYGFAKTGECRRAKAEVEVSEVPSRRLHAPDDEPAPAARALAPAAAAPAAPAPAPTAPAPAHATAPAPTAPAAPAPAAPAPAMPATPAPATP